MDRIQVAGPLQQHPPAHGGGTDAQSQKAQRGLAQDHAGHGQGQGHNQVAHEIGQHVDANVGRHADPHDAGRGYVVELAQLQQLAAHHAGQAAPAHQREQADDGEVGLDHAPVRRQGRAEGEPQRNRGYRNQELDHPLDDHVDNAPEVSGDAPQNDADQERNRDPDKPNR